MITFEIIGMDRYMAYDYSHSVSKNLANLYETKENNIFFQAGDTKLIHDGNDQTSWHVLIRVHADKKYQVLEDKVAKFLLDSATEYILNAHVEFTYFDEHHCYHKYNSDYPEFIIHNDEEKDIEINYEDVDDDEIYEGNVFEGFEEKLDEEDEDEHCHDGHCDCHHHKG